MALITPYGDPNAHGSLADSVSFRRSRGRVIFQKKPNPKNRGTAGQLAQQQAFTDASYAWYSYPAQGKIFFNTRGPQLQMSGRNLFISMYLNNQLYPTTLPQGGNILEGQVQNPVGTLTEEIYHTFRQLNPDLSTWRILGSIVDPTQVFTVGAFGVTTQDLNRVRTYVWDNIPFRYSIWIKGQDKDSNVLECVLRFPELNLTGNQYLYWSWDGSTFWDEQRTILACSGLV